MWCRGGGEKRKWEIETNEEREGVIKRIRLKQRIEKESYKDRMCDGRRDERSRVKGLTRSNHMANGRLKSNRRRRRRITGKKNEKKVSKREKKGRAIQTPHEGKR